jgi:hypothetical protein
LVEAERLNHRGKVDRTPQNHNHPKQTTPWSHPPSNPPDAPCGHTNPKRICVVCGGCWERRTGGPGGACCSSLNQTNHPVSVLHVPSPGVVVAHAQRAKVFCPKKVVDFCACARVAASSAACVVEDVGGGRCRVGDRGFDFPLAVFQFVGLKQKLGSGKIN